MKLFDRNIGYIAFSIIQVIANAIYYTNIFSLIETKMFKSHFSNRGTSYVNEYKNWYIYQDRMTFCKFYKLQTSMSEKHSLQDFFSLKEVIH